MVVPYLRNPRRYRDHPVAIKTRSQYHLEPDHTTITFESSTYTHVGRRTKGGGGGGYLFSSSSNSSTNGGEGEYNPVVFWTIAIFFLVGVALCIAYFTISCICAICSPLCNKRSERIRERQQQPEDRIHPQEFPLSVPDSSRIHSFTDRKQLIRSKLRYQIVLSDKSNSTKDAQEDDDTAASGDDDSIIVSNHAKKPGTKWSSSSRSSSRSSVSSAYKSIKNLVSSWSFFRPRNKETCSICLEGFQLGQTVCIAKIASCDHPFHEECIESWLMEHHDYCPLCRNNIMGDDGLLHL